MKRLIIFSDLDGTLLHHDTYDFKPTLPTISKLKENNIPLVLNSSKTLAEMRNIRDTLGLDTPVAAENGAVVELNTKNSKPKIHGASREELLEVLYKLRQQDRFKFTGFSDLDSEEIANITGLSLDAASLANERMATEPIVWEGTGDALTDFKEELTKSDIHLTRGGRFYHVGSGANKGDAVRSILQHYSEQDLNVEWITVALGDSANDIPMLEAVDIPIIIQAKLNKLLELSPKKQSLVRYAEEPAPIGWVSEVERLLSEHT